LDKGSHDQKTKPLKFYRNCQFSLNLAHYGLVLLCLQHTECTFVFIKHSWQARALLNIGKTRNLSVCYLLFLFELRSLNSQWVSIKLRESQQVSTSLSNSQRVSASLKKSQWISLSLCQSCQVLISLSETQWVSTILS